MTTRDSNFLDSLISVTICLIGILFYMASVVVLGFYFVVKEIEVAAVSVVLYLIGKFIVWFGSNI